MLQPTICAPHFNELKNFVDKTLNVSSDACQKVIDGVPLDSSCEAKVKLTTTHATVFTVAYSGFNINIATALNQDQSKIRDMSINVTSKYGDTGFPFARVHSPNDSDYLEVLRPVFELAVKWIDEHNRKTGGLDVETPRQLLAALERLSESNADGSFAELPVFLEVTNLDTYIGGHEFNKQMLGMDCEHPHSIFGTHSGSNGLTIELCQPDTVTGRWGIYMDEGSKLTVNDLADVLRNVVSGRESASHYKGSNVGDVLSPDETMCVVHDEKSNGVPLRKLRELPDRLVLEFDDTSPSSLSSINSAVETLVGKLGRRGHVIS